MISDGVCTNKSVSRRDDFVEAKHLLEFVRDSMKHNISRQAVQHLNCRLHRFTQTVVAYALWLFCYHTLCEARLRLAPTMHHTSSVTHPWRSSACERQLDVTRPVTRVKTPSTCNEFLCKKHVTNCVMADSVAN